MHDQILGQTDSDIKNTDGNYLIELNEQGVYLTVYPPQGNGVPSNESSIIAELKERCVTEYSYPTIIKTIKEAAGVQVKIGESPLYESEPEIQVSISRDRMEASVQIIKPANSKPLALETVFEKITASGIAFGIDNAAVQRALENPEQQFVVARGQGPVDGSNAYIKYYVELENKARPEELENGKVDFRNLNLFTTAQQGELLAEKIPATPGTSGTDILGNALLPKPGKDLPLPAGKNTQIIENIKLVAAIAGQVLLNNNKIHIAPVIDIKGDVDLSTGNIEFMGNVTVRGSVQAGFTIKAEGNVEVFGTVSGGTVEGKNVVIKMGIQGMGRGYIKATGDVLAKFIENATVYAGNNVIVSEVIFHSKINAAKKVMVQGKRGLISGGRITAGEEIVVKTAGTQMATTTELEVGINPALREEYQRIRKEVKTTEATLDQTQKALNILKSMHPSTMPPDKRELLLRLTKAQFHLVGQIENTRNRITEIELAFEEMKYGRIRIADAIYPGVKIVVGSQLKVIREKQSYTSFYVEDGEIKTGAFN